MEFSRQEYWRGLPFPSLGDLPHPGISRSPFISCIANGFFPAEPLGKPPASSLWGVRVLCGSMEAAPALLPPRCFSQPISRCPRETGLSRNPPSLRKAEEGGQKRQPCAQRPQLTHCRAGAQEQGSEPGTPSLWPLRAAKVWGALGTSGHPARAWTL